MTLFRKKSIPFKVPFPSILLFPKFPLFLSSFIMNCPSRTDESLEDQGWNQNPPALTGDLTTRQDLHGLANSRYQHRSSNPEAPRNFVSDEPPDQKPHKVESLFRPAGANSREGCGPLEMTPKPFQGRGILSKLNSSSTVAGFFNRTNVTKMGRRACQVLLKFSKFALSVQ